MGYTRDDIKQSFAHYLKRIAAQQLRAYPVKRDPQVTGIILVLYELTRQICAESSIEQHRASLCRDTDEPLTFPNQPEA